MKKQIIYLLLFFSIAYSSYSQDIIILKDNVDTIYCNIVEDHIISLDFYLYNSEDSTFYNIKTEEIEDFVLKEDIVKKTDFENYIEKIADNNELDTISLKTKLNVFSTYSYNYPSIVILINHKFYSKNMDARNVGFGGWRLRPYIEKSTEALAYLNNYQKYRYAGFITMWGGPILATSMIASSHIDELTGVSLILLTHITGKIIYHTIAPESLKKSIKSYNKYLRNHPNKIKTP